MKINVEFDLTPDEFRQSLGLPDVEAFQKSLMENIQQQMESGVEGYDPMSLMQPFLKQPMMQQGLSQGLANFGTYQQMMLDMLKQAGTASAAAEPEKKPNQTASNASTSGKESSSDKSAKAKTTASARSRAKS